MIPTELALQLEELRPRLVRFACLQLRDDATAEDALLAAAQSAGSFEGVSAVAIWVFAITDKGQGNFELTVIFLAMLLPLMFSGLGQLSLDALMRRRVLR